MFKRFLSVVLAALIGAATPAVPAQAPSPAIERGALVSAPVALPQLAQRLPDTIPPLYMLGDDASSSSLVASFDSATDPFPSAILSHSRGSLATMFDSTGKLTYAPNQQASYSNTFTGAGTTAWTLSGNFTPTDGLSSPAYPSGGTFGKIVANAMGLAQYRAHFLAQTVTNTPGNVIISGDFNGAAGMNGVIAKPFCSSGRCST